MEVMKTPTPTSIKIIAFIFISITFFYLGKHWSSSSSSTSSNPYLDDLTFFNSHQTHSSIALSPNINITDAIIPPPSPPPPSPPPPPPPSPPPPPKNFGVVDENGVMANDFEIGEFDPDLINEDWNGTEPVDNGDDGSSQLKSRFSVKKYPFCDETKREYIPCLDNVDAIKKLNSTDKGERFERHCPDKGNDLNCLVPPPASYKKPIAWPKSRDEVWFSNVPHSRLVEDKGGQNWITRVKDKFRFPGGGTQFIHGADGYLDQISNMIPEIAFGRNTRVVLDVGCGVASFGAYLLSRDVLTMSVAPKDVHENQIQFALERGVPAMVAAFATHRLLYPSQAFDLIHCSRCRINWTRDDGILLLEVNRLLRGGGYFAWAAQPVYKHEEALENQWEEMFNLTTRLCWELVKKEGYIAIWQKPRSNTCYQNREEGTIPPLCEPDNDPDNVWYVDMKACITPLPENGYGSNVSAWPARLHTAPDRLHSIQIESTIARNELFRAESKYWNEIVTSYVRVFWKKIKFRNVLDMKAGYGGFGAALIDNKLDAWVLNVVPVSGPNTLPVIYDRGLLGVMHDWCEAFDTYPRTYDFLHAANLFSTERKRCSMSSIMLEMDRILRPGGHVYIRDTLDVMDELQAIAKAMGWQVALHDTAEGPHASYRILICEKRLLRSSR
ncbi:hypothetical protein ACFE04_029382 [Oxalis oulophora]